MDKLIQEAFNGREAYSKLQRLAGDNPNQFSSDKSNLEDILIDWGNLAKITISQYNKFPVQEEWKIHKLKPTINGIERSHKIKWSEIPGLFYEKFRDDFSWSEITDRILDENLAKEETDVQIEESCFVYLMKDLRNNAYKIGISNNPSLREKTLQSEQPKTQLIAFKKYVNRKIAGSIEKALHETYKHKKLRGEWFRLDSEDIIELQATLDDKI